MLLGALTPTTGLPPFLTAGHPPASLMVTAMPLLPQPDSLSVQLPTLLLMADPSFLTSCILLKLLRLASGLFLPSHNSQDPFHSTFFVKGYLGQFLSLCVSVCVYVCAQPSRILSRLLFLCKVQIRSDQISCSVVSDSLRPHESQHARPPCPSPTPGVHSDSRPSSQ